MVHPQFVTPCQCLPSASPRLCLSVGSHPITTIGLPIQILSPRIRKGKLIDRKIQVSQCLGQSWKEIVFTCSVSHSPRVSPLGTVFLRSSGGRNNQSSMGLPLPIFPVTSASLDSSCAWGQAPFQCFSSDVSRSLSQTTHLPFSLLLSPWTVEFSSVT